MSNNSKSELLRETADEFDKIMKEFNDSQQRLKKALEDEGFREEKINRVLKLFDNGKAIIEDLIPIKEQVEGIQKTILKPVADVIAQSSRINIRFGIIGLIIGVLGILLGFGPILLPDMISVFTKQPTIKDVLRRFEGVEVALNPIVQKTSTTSPRLLLYDTFEAGSSSFYDSVSITDVGNVGTTLGFNGVGFAPVKELIYKPIEMPFDKSYYICIEVMIKLGKYIDIKTKDIAQKKIEMILPIEVTYYDNATNGWNILDQLQDKINIPWENMQNKWQSIKTEYVYIPEKLGARRIRVKLRLYSWHRMKGKKPIVTTCPTSFDEIKVFAFPSEK